VDGDPRPPPPPTEAPGTTSGSRSRAERLLDAADRARLAAKLRLLRARYVFGYLAASFLVSVPLDVGYRVASGQAGADTFASVGVSILYGLGCLLGFLILRPFTGIPWERVRVPEFAIFEMRVAALSGVVAAILLGASLVAGLAVPQAALFLSPRLFWTVLVLMILAWGKIKLQTLVFPEFYADRGGERILSRDPEP
jgi:hypothetical protein